jgi:hypothetical protein
MKHKVLRSFQYSLPCLVLCLAFIAHARNTVGRNFGGDYKILQAADQGDNVAVRISLRVINNSGADVRDATIRLASSLPTPPSDDAFDWQKQQLPFRNVTLHFNEHKIVPRLVGTFNIPAQEYEQWQKLGPTFTIAYHDASGERQFEKIALAPAP